MGMVSLNHPKNSNVPNLVRLCPCSAINGSLNKYQNWIILFQQDIYDCMSPLFSRTWLIYFSRLHNVKTKHRTMGTGFPALVSENIYSGGWIDFVSGFVKRFTDYILTARARTTRYHLFDFEQAETYRGRVVVIARVLDCRDDCLLCFGADK